MSASYLSPTPPVARGPDLYSHNDDVRLKSRERQNGVPKWLFLTIKLITEKLPYYIQLVDMMVYPRLPRLLIWSLL